MAIKQITGAITMLTVFAVMFFFAIATVDPLYATLSQYSMGGMASEAAGIHEAIVKYMAPVMIASILIVTVFYILRSERQTVR